jgi:hypothetical protein
MYRFTLYYAREATYQTTVKSLTEDLERIRGKWKVEFSVAAIEDAEQTQVEKVRNEIRSIAPQVRGRIVSGNNMVLPLSRSRKLNTINTPILMVYQDDKPVNVYPHMLGTAYFEIDTLLHTVLQNGLETHMTALGLIEEPLQKILADAPTTLEKGMLFLGANVDVGSGVADVLLKDAAGRTAVVEIETKATETAVAQVSRIAAGYARQNNLSTGNIRKIVLCQDFDQKTAKACVGAGVELYKLTVQKAC